MTVGFREGEPPPRDTTPLELLVTGLGAGESALYTLLLSTPINSMTSYAAVLQNTLKFSLAPSALALVTLYFSLKRREKRKKFSFAPSARRKMVDFLYGVPKTCRLFKASVILPPSGKISAGAHATNAQHVPVLCICKRYIQAKCAAVRETNSCLA